MQDAESTVKKGRIRHCYPRQEVYHRFIHDNEYYYSNKAHAISSKGNYLSLGDIGRNKSIADIERYWYPENRIFAVIDRENKKILVSHKYKDILQELLNAIPDNYEVFHCKDDIPLYNILDSENIDTLVKLHIQYSIECYVEHYLYSFYAVLNGKPVLHSNIDELVSEDNSFIKDNQHLKYYNYKYDFIKHFVKKYKVKQRTWYNEVLNDKFRFCIYYPDSWNYITIKLPTVKQVLTNTVFTKPQKELFRKKYFYTKYCYGRGIPFNDVDKYFDAPMLHREAVEYCRKRNIYLNPEWLVDVYTWNELISKTKIIEDKIHSKYIQKQRAESEANYKAAVEELRKLESEYTINDWREGRNFKQNSVTYRKFNVSAKRGHGGTWTTAVVYSSSKTFTNTQLKLEGTIIRTSKNATVTLEEGIKMYNLFNKYRTNYPNCTSMPASLLGSIKIGIYNLRFITYKDKVSDTGTSLGYKEWCIQIGCHSLWLDDIKDFIRYYHLEDKFGIKKHN